MDPLIFEIKGNSLDDGPGIRTVFFFKGCPLSCVWCHNPEGKNTGAEIAFDAAACVDCGACREACTTGCLDRKNPHFIDRDRCTRCWQCVRECCSGALSTVGKSYGVKDLFEIACRDLAFFQSSGGGVTLSGGEPTLFMDFCGELLPKLKSRDIHVLLETCGHFHLEKFDRLIYPYLDAIYMDIKLIDPDLHQKYCGVTNKVIHENFRALYGRYLNGGITVLPRLPLVPGITDTDDNLRGVAVFLRSVGVREAALLPYNPLWPQKTVKLGHTCRCEASWMKREEIGRCTDIFREAGIECVG